MQSKREKVKMTEPEKHQFMPVTKASQNYHKQEGLLVCNYKNKVLKITLHSFMLGSKQVTQAKL